MRRLPLAVVLLTAGLVLLAVLAASPPPVAADLASMVADLAVGEGPNRDSLPGSFVRVGSRVVFFAGLPSGFEGADSHEARYVWSTDGTPEGLERLPVEEVPVSGLGVVDGVYLWVGQEPIGFRTLWRTDGRAAGTVRLADRVLVHGYWEDGQDRPLWTLADGRLHFLRSAGGRVELWRSDGTAAGTTRVAALPPVDGSLVAAVVHRGGYYLVTLKYHSCGPGCTGDYSDWRLWRTDLASGRTDLLHWNPTGDRLPDLYPDADRLLFFPGDGRLWATDGTAGGTAPVPGAPTDPDFYVYWTGGAVGGRLYFSGNRLGHDPELWISDGTRRGTRLLARGLHPDSGVYGAEGRRFFVASDAAHGRELWSTRGTAATTARVRDLCPGPCSAFESHHVPLAVARQRLVFVADDGSHGPEPWSSDGTAEGTVLLRDHCPGSCGVEAAMTSTGGEVFYYLRGGGPATGSPAEPGVALWATDGRPAGTRRLTGFARVDRPMAWLPEPSVARLASRAVTVGWDLRGGEEPWSYDLAGRGGRPLGDLAGGSAAAGTEVLGAVALGERLVLLTDSGAAAHAWSTLGSAGTTIALASVPLAEGDGTPSVAVAAGLAYVAAADLWATDGTPAGTARLTRFAETAPGSRITSEVADLAGRAVFAVTGPDSDWTELWSSDGTPAGTGPARTSPPGFPRPIAHLTSVGAQLYFWAWDDVDGWEVRCVDAGFGAVRRITNRAGDLPGASDTPPRFTRIGARVYFLMPSTGGGPEIWRTDGTPEGTLPVPPPTPWGVSERAFVEVNGSMLELTRDREDDRLRLWAGSGSGGDWVELHDFGPGAFTRAVVRRAEDVLVLVDGFLLRTDGTAAGTFPPVDLGALGLVDVRELAAVGDRLFFSAGEQWAARELWISEGTTATTRRLHEIVPGPWGSQPSFLVTAGSRFYFTADDGVHGRELWSLPLDRLDAPCRPSATALCLGDGRFRAELYRYDRDGGRGDARAVPWSSGAGAFWFYAYGNPEAAVKMVDGGAVNGRHWLFYGPLGDAYVALTVTDLESGETRRYPERGRQAAFADLAAFPSSGPASGGTASVPGLPTNLSLHEGRFTVELTWTDPAGAEHAAFAFAHGDRAGYFSFYGVRDLQAALKILDGRPVNGRYWLFGTSLTHLGTTLTVTDHATGAVRVYPKPAGDLATLVDLDLGNPLAVPGAQGGGS